MSKAFIIPKTQYFHPGKPVDFNRLLRYLESRPGVMQQPIPTPDGSSWADRGLGSGFKAIGQQCDEWQSRRVLGRHLIIAPDPELLNHVPEQDRASLMARTTETTISQWFDGNGWGQPEYSYVLHDKEKNDVNMMHAHVIVPGTIQPDPDLRRMSHFVSRPHILDLHAVAANAFEHEFERTLGRDRAQQLMRERDERVARERRAIWAKQHGSIPPQNRNRLSLDWNKLSAVRRVVRLMKRPHPRAHATKNSLNKERERRQAEQQRELRRLARQRQADQRVQDTSSRQAERVQRMEQVRQRRIQREAQQHEALEQARQQNLQRLKKLRAIHIPYADMDRDIER